MLNNLEQALNRVRQSGQNPDLKKGMAMLFEDTSDSIPIAIVTVEFAKRLCEIDAYYTWEPI